MVEHHSEGTVFLLVVYQNYRLLARNTPLDRLLVFDRKLLNHDLILEYVLLHLNNKNAHEFKILLVVMLPYEPLTLLFVEIALQFLRIVPHSLDNH